MAISTSLRDRQFATFAEVGSGLTATRVTYDSPGGTGNMYGEGILVLNLATGSTNAALKLNAGSTNQFVNRVMVSIPSASSDGSGVTVQFFDNTPTGSALTGAYQLNNQPVDGFPVNRNIVSGSLGIQVNHKGSAGPTLFGNVFYGY